MSIKVYDNYYNKKKKKRIPNKLTPTLITLKQHNIPSQILPIYHKLESNHTKGEKNKIRPSNRPYKIK